MGLMSIRAAKREAVQRRSKELRLRDHGFTTMVSRLQEFFSEECEDFLATKRHKKPQR